MKQVVGQRALQNARAKKQHGKDAPQFYAQAVAFHTAGAHAEAQALCERILQNLPDHFDALHLLGASKSDLGDYESAEEILRRAVKVQPRSAVAHYHLGIAQFELRHYNAARASYSLAISLQPNFPLAHNNLGNTLNLLNLREEAIESYDRALAYQPNYPDALYNRGGLLLLMNRGAEALANLDRCLALQPNHDRALNARGLALMEVRRLNDAIVSFERTSQLNPKFANAHANRGRALAMLGRFRESGEALEKALEMAPKLETAWLGLAEAYLLTGQLEKAFDTAYRALEIVPEAAEVVAVVGQCHAERGEIDEAVRYFDRALALKPTLASAFMQKLFALDFASWAGFEQHQAARKEWWQQIGSKVAPELPVQHPNDRDPERKLVLGYVSSDFRSHSAALAYIAILRNHDRTAFTVNCYSCSPLRDQTTEEFIQMADRWVDASRMSDEELDATIRADKVDVLIDLSGFTAGNRLSVFARKPAPVQLSAWGNATGTGSPTQDYVFADPVTVPAASRHFFAERVHDLPVFMTMEMPPAELVAAEPPCITRGSVTFGVYNRVNKISNDAVRVWSEILGASANSRLVIKHTSLDDTALVRSTTERFVAHGIAAERIVCVGSTTRRNHLLSYADIDICLDPFPQNGGISTWEALHMGVPVVAKLGNSYASRISCAIQWAIGLGDWMREDEAGYIEFALKLANDPEYLRTMRAELPSRIEASEGGNPLRYAKAVDNAYRSFWRRYCGVEPYPPRE